MKSRLLAALLCLITSAPAVPVPIWGPLSRNLNGGAFAKEALDNDCLCNCYSAGFEQTGGSTEARLIRRDNTGALTGTGTPPAALVGAPSATVFAGVDAETSGADIFVVGTHYPAGVAPGQPSRLLVVKYNSAFNITAQLTLAAIPGLAGVEVTGCRVFIPPTGLNILGGIPAIFVCGCTEQGIFVMPLDRMTLSPVVAWGNGGAFAIGGVCPRHLMPGIQPAQVPFHSCRQSFMEMLPQASLYLGGTLGTGNGGQFTVARIGPVTGQLIAPFGVQTFPAGGNFVKAMAVAGQNAVAHITLAGGTRQVTWDASGAVRSVDQGQVFANAGQMPLLQSLNDVEMRAGLFNGLQGSFVHLCGKHAASGQVWCFFLPVANFPPLFLYSRDYGAAPDAANEAVDLALGTRAPYVGWTVATGVTKAGTNFDAPLMAVHPAGTPFSYSALPNQNPPLPDRGNAALWQFPCNPHAHGNRETVPGSAWEGRQTYWLP